MQKKITNRHVFSHQPLTANGKIAVGALMGTSVLCGLLSIVAGLLLLIIAACVLIVAALIASGIRWMPLLSCLASVFIFYDFYSKHLFPSITSLILKMQWAVFRSPLSFLSSF